MSRFDCIGWLRGQLGIHVRRSLGCIGLFPGSLRPCLSGLLNGFSSGRPRLFGFPGFEFRFGRLSP